jgi:molybdate transport system ATP-binding protein
VSQPDDRLLVQVRKRLGEFELECDIRLPLRGLTAIFGPSGSGKSTLINLVAGLLRPESGCIAVGSAVFFDHAQAVDAPVERRALGVVFQDARLFPHLSVRGNLQYGLRRAGARAQPARIGFDQVVALLGIEALLERRPHTLSGGERQRVALGRALLAQPRLLLMDEPLAALDAGRKGEVLPYIERLRDELRVPVLYVTHSLDEVLRLATAIVLLDHGKVVVAGALADVAAHPRANELFGFDIGALAFGRIAAHDERYGQTRIAFDGFDLRVPRVALPVGAAVRARIPGRDVALALTRPGDVSISNRVEGRVESINPLNQSGTQVEVAVRVAPGTVLRALVTREAVDRLALQPGLSLWCLVKSVALDAGTLALARGTAAMRGDAANDAGPSAR